MGINQIRLKHTPDAIADLAPGICRVSENGMPWKCVSIR